MKVEGRGYFLTILTKGLEKLSPKEWEKNPAKGKRHRSL